MDELQIGEHRDHGVESELINIELLSRDGPQRLRVVDNILTPDKRGEARRHADELRIGRRGQRAGVRVDVTEANMNILAAKALIENLHCPPSNRPCTP